MRRSPLSSVRPPLFRVAALIVASGLWAAAPVFAERVVDVAFILDSSFESVRVDEIVREELSAQLDSDYRVRFPKELRIVVGGDRASAKAAADRLFADDSIDVVIGLGSVAALELGSRGALSKPAFAAFMFDTQLLGLPRRGDTSGLHNFSYSASSVDIEGLLALLERAAETAEASKVALLISATALESEPDIRRRVAELEGTTGVAFELVGVGDMLASVVARVPADADAVISMPLLAFSEQEVRAFAAALVARRIPTFSMLGAREVELGFVASNSADSEYVRIAQHLARNVERALEGADPATLPVGAAVGTVLTVNAETAVKAEALPPEGLLENARVLNREALHNNQKLTLSAAMEESVQVNLDLRAEERVVAAGRSDVLLAIARLLPQARASYLAEVIDHDRAAADAGDSPERRQLARIELDQVLFDEKLLADVSIRKHALAADEAFRDQVRLDVIQGTGVAFLEVLRAVASLRIQQENERVTRENLKLAETRRRIGTAAAGEVYRWRSQLARDERSTIFALRDRRQAEIALNRILNRKSESPLDLDAELLGAVAHVFADEEMHAILRTPSGFELMRSWFVADAMEQAPELRELAAKIQAQERVLVSVEQEMWSPTFSLKGRFESTVDEDGAGVAPGPSTEDDEEWTLGIEAGIPLFAGGRRLFARRQANDVLSELRIRQDATRRRIDEAVRSAAFQAWSSFLAIDLSRTASDAAARNLDLVTKSYGRGTVSVVDLLDAQNAATNSADEAESAVYDHLIDVLDLQRAIGHFWIFVPADERRAELDRLRARLAH